MSMNVLANGRGPRMRLLEVVSLRTELKHRRLSSLVAWFGESRLGHMNCTFGLRLFDFLIWEFSAKTACAMS